MSFENEVYVFRSDSDSAWSILELPYSRAIGKTFPSPPKTMPHTEQLHLTVLLYYLQQETSIKKRIERL